MPDSGPKPGISSWHRWTGHDGNSYQTECRPPEVEPHQVGGADPQWTDKHSRSEAIVVVTVRPVGWVGDWP